MQEYKFACKDQKELDRRRNDLKASAKVEGCFLKCEGNTIYCKNGSKYTFFIEGDVPADVDETLPKEAFEGTEIYRKAARDMVE
jgi:hypothetical protein